jgi:two-component system response regulator MprA
MAAQACGTSNYILVVEDEVEIQLALKEALEWEGYPVITASNGSEALDTLSRVLHPCVILLDLMMPGMNGWEFSETVRADERLSTIPIVVVSAYTDRAYEIGAQEAIRKPVNLNNLFSLVKKYCGGQPHES